MSKERYALGRSPLIDFIFDRYKCATASKNGVVELRVTWERRQKYMSTGIRLKPKEWDKKRQRVINRVDAQVLNQMLDKLLIDVRKAIYEMQTEGSIDIFALPAYMNGKYLRSSNFLEFIKAKMNVLTHGLAAGTKKKYEIFFDIFNAWGKIKYFRDVTDDNIIEFDKFLRNKGLREITAWCGYHQFLKTFILQAINEGHLRRNPYKTVKICRGDDSEGIDRFLMPEEFSRLLATKLSNERLERVRDLFAFQAYCCLSYEELASFDFSKLRDVASADELAQVLEGNRQKTSVRYTVPLRQKAVEILQKYNGLPAWNARRQKIICAQTYNRLLKDVAKEANIDRPIATHWARHTGATQLLNLGVPLMIVSKVLGHSSVKITERIYAKVLNTTIVDEVLAVDNRLAEYEAQNKAKLRQVLDIAIERISCKSLDSKQDITEAFNDYFHWHENSVKMGRLPSLGDAAGSKANRITLAEKLIAVLRDFIHGNIPDDQVPDNSLSEDDMTKIQAILKEIAEM